MFKRLRTQLTVAASLVTVAGQISNAQSLSIYGGAEAAGLGEGSAILGATLGTGHLGWNPVVSANIQTYRYRSGATTVQNSAVVPAVGLEYRTHSGNVTGQVGYNFTTKNSNLGGGIPIFGNISGSTSSVVLSVSGNYWADPYEHQAIASYNVDAQYLWTRFRAAMRPVSTTPLYLGAQVGAQGTPKFNSQYRFQVGPTANYHFNSMFHLGGSVGVLTRNHSNGTTGYASIEFVLLPKL